MKHTLLIILFALTFSNAAATQKKFPEGSWPPLNPVVPQWFTKPTYVLDIAWTRAFSTIAEQKDGVCRLFYSDSDEQAMDVADAQVEQCLASGKALTTLIPPADTRRVHIYRVNSKLGVRKAWSELFDVANVPAFRQQATDSVGFYYDPHHNVCTIVVDWTQHALGHEIRHCFDGNFHTGTPITLPLQIRGLSSIFIR